MKIGDRIEILVDNLQFARVKRGEIGDITGVWSDTIRYQMPSEHFSWLCDIKFLGIGFRLIPKDGYTLNYQTGPNYLLKTIDENLTAKGDILRDKLNEAPKVQKCTCPWSTVYANGCQCGGI